MAVKNIIIISIVLFPITVQLDQIYSFFGTPSDPVEYKISIGDSHTYRYLNIYDSRLDDPYKSQFDVIAADGRSRTFMIENGSEFKITIINVTNDEIFGTRTIDEATFEEEEMYLFVRPMTSNISLFTEYYIGEYTFYGGKTIEIRDNLIIEEVIEYSFYSEGEYYDLNRNTTSIWEKNGWLNHMSIRIYDMESVYYEIEFTRQFPQRNVLKSNEVTGIILLGVIFIILIFFHVSKRKKFQS